MRVITGISALFLMSWSASSAPLYFNSSEVTEDGTWDWENKGYIIGGGDGQSGELILKGTSTYNHSFSVGVDGGKGSLTIAENAKNLNSDNTFKVGTVSEGNNSVNDTTGF